MSTDHAPSPSRSTRRSPRGSIRDPRDGAGPPGYDEFDEAYDDAWDDDEELLGAPPRILWGRIAFFGAALLLAFVVGRLTAGGDDGAAEAAQARVEELTSQLEQARAEIDALEAGGAPAEGSQGGGAESAEPDGDAPSAAGAADASPGDGGETGGAEDTGAAEAAADGSAAEDEAAPAEPEATTYTVQSGDYLFGLAERFYNNGRLWRVISEANDLGPGAVISPGQTLTIPPAP